MELLLNLLWLTLALPAIWMWRHQSVSAKNCHVLIGFVPLCSWAAFSCCSSPWFLLRMICMRMGQEIEESSASKRVVKQAVVDKSLTRIMTAGPLPALIFPSSIGLDDKDNGRVSHCASSSPGTKTRFGKSCSRAPPFPA